MPEQVYRIEVQAVAVDQTGMLERAEQKVSRFEKSIRRTEKQIQDMTKDEYEVRMEMRDLVTRNLDRLGYSIRSLTSRAFTIPIKIADYATRPIRSIMHMATSLPGMAALGFGSWGGIMKPMSAASDMDTTQIGFSTMLKSKAAGNDFYDQMKTFAEKTPFQFKDVTGAAQRMMAYGWDTKSIIKDLTTIGDASSGLGKGTEGIDRITLALGQMRMSGRVNAQDMNQLTDVGVAGWRYLADASGKSIAQIRKESEKGALDSQWAYKVILRGMQKDFAGGMEKQSRTFNGLISTIQDVFDLDIVTAWGAGLNKAAVPRLQKLTDMLTNNKKLLNGMKDTLSKIAYQGMDSVLKQAEKLIGKFNVLSKSQKFQDASLLGKAKMVWEDVIVEPFDQWWGSKGEKVVTDRAGKIGETLGGAIGGTLAGLLGISASNINKDLGPFTEAGVIAGKAFFDAFWKAFDIKRLANKTKTAFINIQPEFMGGKSKGKGAAAALGLDAAALIGGLALLAAGFKRGKGVYKNIDEFFDIFRGVKKLRGLKGGAKAAAEVGMEATEKAARVVKPSELTKYTDETAEAVRVAAGASGAMGRVKMPPKRTPKVFVESATRAWAVKGARATNTSVKAIDMPTKAAKWSIDEAKHLGKASKGWGLDIGKETTRAYKIIERASGKISDTPVNWVKGAYSKLRTASDVMPKTSARKVTAGKGATKWAENIIDKVGESAAKEAGGAAKGASKLGAFKKILGPLSYLPDFITFATAKNKVKAGAGIAGSTVGMVAGGAIGSVVPGAGTFIGGVVGSMIGEKLGKGLYGTIAQALEKIKPTKFKPIELEVPRSFSSLGARAAREEGEAASKAMGKGLGKTGAGVADSLSEVPKYIRGAGASLEGAMGELGTKMVTALVTAINANKGKIASALVLGLTAAVTKELSDSKAEASNSKAGGTGAKKSGSNADVKPATKAEKATSKGSKSKGTKDDDSKATKPSSGASIITGSKKDDDSFLDSMLGWITGGRRHAEGGLFDEMHYAQVAEQGPEAIIPLSHSRRSRGLTLWKEAGKRMGVLKPPTEKHGNGGLFSSSKGGGLNLGSLVSSLLGGGKGSRGGPKIDLKIGKDGLEIGGSIGGFKGKLKTGKDAKGNELTQWSAGYGGKGGSFSAGQKYINGELQESSWNGKVSGGGLNMGIGQTAKDDDITTKTSFGMKTDGFNTKVSSEERQKGGQVVYNKTKYSGSLGGNREVTYSGQDSRTALKEAQAAGVTTPSKKLLSKAEITAARKQKTIEPPIPIAPWDWTKPSASAIVPGQATPSAVESLAASSVPLPAEGVSPSKSETLIPPSAAPVTMPRLAEDRPSLADMPNGPDKLKAFNDARSQYTNLKNAKGTDKAAIMSDMVANQGKPSAATTPSPAKDKTVKKVQPLKSKSQSNQDVRGPKEASHKPQINKQEDRIQAQEAVAPAATLIEDTGSGKLQDFNTKRQQYTNLKNATGAEKTALMSEMIANKDKPSASETPITMPVLAEDKPSNQTVTKAQTAEAKSESKVTYIQDARDMKEAVRQAKLNKQDKQEERIQAQKVTNSAVSSVAEQAEAAQRRAQDTMTAAPNQGVTAKGGITIQVAAGAVQVQMTVQANANGQLDEEQIKQMITQIADPLAEEIAKRFEASEANSAA